MVLYASHDESHKATRRVRDEADDRVDRLVLASNAMRICHAATTQIANNLSRHHHHHHHYHHHHHHHNRCSRQMPMPPSVAGPALPSFRKQHLLVEL